MNNGDCKKIISILGEFLKNRSWTGLETSLGQTEVKMAVEGKKGIAAGYEDEPS